MKPVLHISRYRGGLPVFTLPAFHPHQSRIYGGVLLKKQRIWIYPAFYPFYKKVLNDLKSLFPDVPLSPEAQQHVEDCAQIPDKITALDTQGFTPKYPNYDHQQEALVSAMWNPRYGLFLDRGLGKTKVIVDLVSHLKESDPDFMCLVIALRVNLYTWQDEAEKFTDGKVKAMPLVASSPKQREKRLFEMLEKKPDIIVVTYDTCRVAHDLLKENVPYKMIVADESHRLRGYKSKQTKAVHSLAGKAHRRILLTGTASLGDPRHLWGQLRFLGKFLVPSFWDFKQRYVKVAPWNKHIVVGFKNIHLLNKQVAEVSLQRDSEECLDLPERIFQEITVSPSPEQKKVYNKLIKSSVLDVGPKQVPINDKIVALGKLAQISSGFVYLSRKDPTICDGCPHLSQCVQSEISPYTKLCSVVQKDPGNDVFPIGKSNPHLEAITQLTEDHLEEGKKVIVWAKHRHMLSILHEKLEETAGKVDPKIKVLRYDSFTKSHRDVEKEFNENPDARIIVAQVSMGIGVTFKAPIMIYAELDWGLDHWLQSLDRNFGIRAKGQKRLLVQTVVVRGSIMDYTRKLLANKINVSTMITKAPECVSCDLSLTCMGKGIRPYESGCKFDKETGKVTIKTPLLS